MCIRDRARDMRVAAARLGAKITKDILRLCHAGSEANALWV